jgi:hypothetical protein
MLGAIESDMNSRSRSRVGCHTQNIEREQPHVPHHKCVQKNTLTAPRQDNFEFGQGGQGAMQARELHEKSKTAMEACSRGRIRQTTCELLWQAAYVFVR